MSSGRRSERRGEQARSKAATRVRCETGNPRRGAPAAAPPGAARTPAELCRRRPWVSAFRLGVPEWDALPEAVLTPGDRVAPPAPRGRPGRSADRARGAREAHVRLRPGRGCARSAAGSWPRRGFKCILGAGARGAGSEFSPAQPLLRRPAWPAAPGIPLLGPLARDGPPAGGRDPGAGSPKSNVEAPPGKEVRLPLHAARSGIWNRQEIVPAPSLRPCSQPSLC
nr:uncharacterized protein LOC116280465 [Vicugna pacos]